MKIIRRRKKREEIIKKMLVGFLIGVMCLGSSFTVCASETSVMAGGEVVEIVEISDEDIAVMPRKVNKSGDFALGSNENYFSVSFDAKNGANDPHKVFTLKISDVTGGKWYATIKSDAGYSYTSEEHSGGATITTKNLNPDVEYEVTLYWVRGTASVHGKYTMSTGY